MNAKASAWSLPTFAILAILVARAVMLVPQAKTGEWSALTPYLAPYAILFVLALFGRFIISIGAAALTMIAVEALVGLGLLGNTGKSPSGTGLMVMIQIAFSSFVGLSALLTGVGIEFWNKRHPNQPIWERIAVPFVMLIIGSLTTFLIAFIVAGMFGRDW